MNDVLMNDKWNGCEWRVNQAEFSSKVSVRRGDGLGRIGLKEKVGWRYILMSCQGMQGRPGDLKAGKVVEVTIFKLCMDTDLNNTPAPFKLSAEHFLKILEQKVANFRAGTVGMPGRRSRSLPKHPSRGFDCFGGWLGSSWLPSTKSCSLDQMPTSILKEAIDVLWPYLTVMCNASLHSGQLPVSQRHAVITPLLKKSFLDAAELKNYRPVSNLAFISKVTERIVSRMVTSGCRRITSPHYMSNLFLPISPDTLNQTCIALDAKKTLVNAFVASRLDYCNLLHHGIAARIYWTDCSECRLRRHWSSEIRPYHSGSSCSASGAFRGDIGPCPFRPKKNQFWPFGQTKISFGHWKK